MKLNYSEYESSSEEKYYARRCTNHFIYFDQFQNGVAYQADKKMLNIEVTGAHEPIYHYMISDIDESYFTSSLPDWEEMRNEWKAENEIFRKRFTDKFDINFAPSDPCLPSVVAEYPRYNVLSASKINVPLGKGILDFVYADTESAIEEISGNLKFELWLQSMSTHKAEEGTQKIKNIDEENDYYYERYLDTVYEFRKLIFSSLYTAAFPPVFRNEKDRVRAFEIYCGRLKMVREEYLEMIEFCFDEDFYPDVLGNLHPSERYNLYKKIKGYPVSSERTELFVLRPMVPMGEKMPYGRPREEITERLHGHIERTEQLHELCERFGKSEDDIESYLHTPCFIATRYSITNIFEMLELEFTKMLESNIRLRKCKRCGRYFIMKGNYKTQYCDRIEKGKTQNCQELAAQEKYKAKIAENKAIPIYHKYYNRYADRVKKHQLKEEDFNDWKYPASAKRDECTDGKITIDEYIDWLEGCFPNRPLKK